MPRQQRSSGSTATKACELCGDIIKVNALASHTKACTKKSTAKKRARELDEVVTEQNIKAGKHTWFDNMFTKYNMNNYKI